ncbi:hypothetical protein [Cognatiyoonia sp. IB215182]|uniref:hypothetical protein n=1 Tax=Cognatiyoonia sp. IB215182 TaxID=3097353 RepID=UPI002A0ECACD|nr:hypothetical protein [Cognatiyoonia sp. IB215182]MDX8354474.1 hypothetical protein [Cognatiyoonia sp. IB215182]
MDTTLTFAPKTVAAVPYVAEREIPRDTKVPVVKGFEGAATLPANKPFVAQVVNARLSGTDFPEQPAEIAPSERTLRPYGTPMLPSEERPQPVAAEEPADVAAERVAAAEAREKADETAQADRAETRSSDQSDDERFVDDNETKVNDDA